MLSLKKRGKVQPFGSQLTNQFNHDAVKKAQRIYLKNL